MAKMSGTGHERRKDSDSSSLRRRFVVVASLLGCAPKNPRRVDSRMRP